MVSFNGKPDNLGLRSQDETEALNQEVETVTYKHVAVPKETRFISRIRQFVKGILKEVGDSYQKVIKNCNCKNHYVAMRHTMGRVKLFATSIFKKMVEQFKAAGEALAKHRIVRKLKESIEYLQKCDFSFVRRPGEPFLKDDLKQFEELITFYREFEENEEKLEPEEALNQSIMLLKFIGKLKFDPKKYSARNGMVAEVLTKHVVAHPLPASIALPIPCFDPKGHPVVVNYCIAKQLSLSTTDIPVYVFVPILEAERAVFSPILIFRGTRFGFGNEADIRSIIENLNKIGPARGVYDEFKENLTKLFRQWFEKKDTKTPLFRVMGYSQGAVLGQRACVDFYEYLEKKGSLNPSFFFNSPAVERDYVLAWEAIKPSERPDVKNVLVTHDPVSKRGIKFIGEVYDIDPLKKCGFIEAHTGVKFIAKWLEVYHVDNEKEAESYTRLLMNQVMSSDIVDGIYQFIVSGLNKVYGKVKPATLGTVKAF